LLLAQRLMLALKLSVSYLNLLVLDVTSPVFNFRLAEEYSMILLPARCRMQLKT